MSFPELFLFSYLHFKWLGNWNVLSHVCVFFLMSYPFGYQINSSAVRHTNRNKWIMLVHIEFVNFVMPKSGDLCLFQNVLGHFIHTYEFHVVRFYPFGKFFKYYLKNKIARRILSFRKVFMLVNVIFSDFRSYLYISFAFTFYRQSCMHAGSCCHIGKYFNKILLHYFTQRYR